MKMVFISTNKYEVYFSPKDVPYFIEGYMPDLSAIRKHGGMCRSELLDNQPIYKGFLPPILDGKNTLRYETEEMIHILYSKNKEFAYERNI